jgi:hypothetical protein
MQFSFMSLLYYWYFDFSLKTLGDKLHSGCLQQSFQLCSHEWWCSFRARATQTGLSLNIGWFLSSIRPFAFFLVYFFSLFVSQTEAVVGTVGQN